MSRPPQDDPAQMLRMPSRRRALFAARDLMLASVAAPALASPAALAQTTAAVRVLHGFADAQTMTLWLQGNAAQSLRIELRPAEGPGRVRALSAELDPRADFVAVVRIVDLEAGTTYRYSVHGRDRREPVAAGTFRTQVYWHWRTEPPTVRIATGSCAYLNDFKWDRPGNPYGGGEEIFDNIAALSPDLMLWLGDNLYLRESEWTSREAINARYRYYRSHPRLQKLMQAAPHVAIWDDHDFGPNDSDASFVNRQWTQEMFRRYWPLPYPAPADGLYGMVTVGDVDIFLLDNRSNRYPNRWPEGPEKAMFGAAQMQWLKAALTYSNAPFKLVCGGNQFFNKVSRYESWARYPAEQADLLRFLEAARIPGVIFISGDRHFASMLRVPRQGFYSLHEVTTSPLTSGVFVDREEVESKNPDMVPGTMFKDRNFALITVSGPRTKRELLLELRDTRGDKRWEWRTTADELAEGTRRA